MTAWLDDGSSCLSLDLLRASAGAHRLLCAYGSTSTLAVTRNTVTLAAPLRVSLGILARATRRTPAAARIWPGRAYPPSTRQIRASGSSVSSFSGWQRLSVARASLLVRQRCSPLS